MEHELPKHRSLRNRIEEQTRQFLQSGGEIEVCDPPLTRQETISHAKEHWKEKRKAQRKLGHRFQATL